MLRITLSKNIFLLLITND